MAREPKEYEVVIWQGQEARRYENGVIRNDRGTILHLPPGVALKMREERKKKAEEAAERGLAKAAGTETPDEAWAKVIEARSIIALTDPGRAGNDAARLVGLAMNYFTNERSVEHKGTVQHVPVPIDPEMKELLEKLLQARRDNREYIEGEYSDVERKLLGEE